MTTAIIATCESRNVRIVWFEIYNCNFSFSFQFIWKKKEEEEENEKIHKGFKNEVMMQTHKSTCELNSRKIVVERIRCLWAMARLSFWNLWIYVEINWIIPANYIRFTCKLAFCWLTSLFFLMNSFSPNESKPLFLINSFPPSESRLFLINSWPPSESRLFLLINAFSPRESKLRLMNSFPPSESRLFLINSWPPSESRLFLLINAFSPSESKFRLINSLPPSESRLFLMNSWPPRESM